MNACECKVHRNWHILAINSESIRFGWQQLASLHCKPISVMQLCCSNNNNNNSYSAWQLLSAMHKMKLSKLSKSKATHTRTHMYIGAHLHINTVACLVHIRVPLQAHMHLFTQFFFGAALFKFEFHFEHSQQQCATKSFCELHNFIKFNLI